MPPITLEVTDPDGVNIRTGRGVEFPIVRAAPMGEVLEVIDPEGDWIKVLVSGQERFVAAQFVRLSTAGGVSGFLVNRPELMEVGLEPDRNIPTEGLVEKVDLAVAKAWNGFGGLIDKVAEMLGIPRNAVVAVLVAESSGRPFASDGRMIIRFENHIFYRQWGEQHQEIFDRFFKFNTSSPANSWKGHQWRPTVDAEWRGFHGSQKREWEVLEFAHHLDDTAAKKSISMGAPQVMGFNFRSLGYESVQHMFNNFARSTHAQLLGMFDFVKGPSATSRAIEALQRHDYLTFATFYNGSGNAETYRAIMQRNADVFDRLFSQAVPSLVPDITSRGPADTPPVEVVHLPTTTPAPVSDMPPLPSPTAVTAPPAPPTNQLPLLVATTDLNVRREADPGADNVLEVLKEGEVVSLLEPAEAAREKIAAGKAGGQWVNVRTDEGNEGFVAAWLVEVSSLLSKADVDAYIDSIPDEFPIPLEYDQLWGLQDRLGLPDPFDTLPVQAKTTFDLVNMMINGFGPNSFAYRNWPDFYKSTTGMHNGIDYIVELGRPLLAVSDGVIITSWPFMKSKAEKTVVLWCYLPERFNDAQGRRRLSNVLVAYGHMSNNTLKKELAEIRAGEVIGISGRPAGASSNDHLHMEVHLLSGDHRLLRPCNIAPRRLLRFYKRDQPFDNRTPFNPLLFFSRRLVRYHLHQGRTIGYFGGPPYPTRPQLQAVQADHLPDLDYFSLGYYEYCARVVWEDSGRPWPNGVVSREMLLNRLEQFEAFESYPADFLG